jgi:putative aldouronate transport system substrate-binding protein
MIKTIKELQIRGGKQMLAKSRTWISTACLSLIVIVSACSSGNTGSSTGAAGASGKTGDAGGATVQKAGAPVDPYFGKYDPPIEMTTVRITDSTFKYPPGDSLENNVWTRSLLDKLGIKVKNDWVVDKGQAEQKMNVSIASGNLPQFIPVNAKQLQQLYEAGKLMDLTEIYAKHAAPFTKEIMNQDGPNALASATFGGKLMAIPNTGSSMDGTPLIWVRQDWLEKLKLPAPKTMNDVFAISSAFTTMDPDGNGKNDTIGLSLFKDLYGGFADLKGFFNGYHAYPQQWIKDASGKLVFGSVQPEIKTALLALQGMYKKGEIDKEFGVKDTAKAAELAASGKTGLLYGTMSIPISYLADNITNDPKAQWKSYPLASIDSKPAKPQVGFSTSTYYAVLKEAKNPEALLKAINLFVETGWGKSTTTENYAEHFNKDGINRHPYMPFAAWPARKNLDAHLHVVKALESKDKSILNPEEVTAYDRIINWESGKGVSSDWARERIFGKDGAFAIINNYVINKTLNQSEFFIAPTESMVAKESTLKKMELEVFTKIILGDPIDSFDKFVDNWKKLGGDQITDEVNKWYKSK